MNHHVRLFTFAFILFSCNQTDEESCPAPDFNAVQYGSGGGIQIYDQGWSGAYGFYEVQYGQNGFSFGSGTTQSINNNGTISGLAGGTYDVYLRGNCGGTDWSEWTGPQSLLIQGGTVNPACGNPTGLDVYWTSAGYNLNWDGPAEADYYQVQYKQSGFALGTGIIVNTNYESYSDGVFIKNSTYEFYVRAYCGSDGWSDWVGPESFFADNNANRCFPPLSFTAERSGSYIEIDLVPDGEDQHEVNFNNSDFIDSDNIHTQNQTNGTYGTFYTNVTYYAWVRSVCNDGSKTAWTGPVVIY